MKLSVQSTEKGGVVRVAAVGRLSSVDLTEKNPLAFLIGDHWASCRVLLDFDQVEYIDSSAIVWLVESHKQLSCNGGKMVLHSIRPNVKQVFDLLKIGSLFTLAKNETEALSCANGDKQ